MLCHLKRFIHVYSTGYTHVLSHALLDHGHDGYIRCRHCRTNTKKTNPVKGTIYMTYLGHLHNITAIQYNIIHHYCYSRSQAVQIN